MIHFMLKNNQLHHLNQQERFQLHKIGEMWTESITLEMFAIKMLVGAATLLHSLDKLKLDWELSMDKSSLHFRRNLC